MAKRNADERAVLLRVSQAATSSSSMREMLDEIAAVAIELRNVETCSVRLWHPKTQILERVAGVRWRGGMYSTSWTLVWTRVRCRTRSAR